MASFNRAWIHYRGLGFGRQRLRNFDELRGAALFDGNAVAAVREFDRHLPLVTADSNTTPRSSRRCRRTSLSIRLRAFLQAQPQFPLPQQPAPLCQCSIPGERFRRREFWS